MRQASKFRGSIKKAVYGSFHPKTVEKVRNFVNLKDKYFAGNRKNIYRIKSLASYANFLNGSSRGLELLIDLHKMFPTYNNVQNYTYEALRDRAAMRLKYISDFGITLEKKDLFDIGAGHGESIHVLQEFGLSSVIAFDYSDKDFNKFKDKLPEETQPRFKFAVQDLVKEALPSNSADVIVSSSAFEHFSDPPSYHRSLLLFPQEGGILYTDFAAFHVPFAPHRKIFTGVPYITKHFPR